MTVSPEKDISYFYLSSSYLYPSDLPNNVENVKLKAIVKKHQSMTYSVEAGIFRLIRSYKLFRN